MEKIAEKLGLNREATEEEILAKIESSQKETEDLKKSNLSLIETNKNLTASEAGTKARVEELEKQYKDLVEGKEDKKDTPKTDIDRLVEVK